MNPSSSVRVKIWAPFKIYFDGPADSLSAINETGPFDVLSRHKNFISLLSPGPIIVRRQGQPDFKINIQRGIIHVKTNQATVFLDV